MKLYLLTTKQVGDFYVVAENTNDAEIKLKGLLDKADYGFYESRDVKNIEVLANEVTEFSNKPFFSNGSNLILPNSCSENSIK